MPAAVNYALQKNLLTKCSTGMRRRRPLYASQANGSTIHQNECVNYLSKQANKRIE